MRKMVGSKIYIHVFNIKWNKYFIFIFIWKFEKTDEDDKQISRELAAADKDGQTYLPEKTYKVTVVTGDRYGAGTG